MAYKSSKKTTSKSNEAFRKLKSDLADGTLGCAYLFYGEESYLREYYLGELRKSWFRQGSRSSTTTGWRARTSPSSP